MEGWKKISDFEASEQQKLRWLLRHAADNGIVHDSIALKFGREWRINEKKLPVFLRKLTLASLSGAA